MSRRLQAALLSLGLYLQAQEPVFEIPISRAVSFEGPFVEGELHVPKWGFWTRKVAVRLLFDTGAEVNLLRSDLGEGFLASERVNGELNDARGEKLPTAGRRVLKGRQRLKLGPAKFSGLRFYALPTPFQRAVERAEGLPLDGLLGLGELGEVEPRLLWDIDPEAGRIRCFRPEAFDLSAWVRLPTSRRGKLIFAHLRVAGREVKALVDTGYAGGLELSRADGGGLPFQEQASESFKTTTLGGTVPSPATEGRLTTEVQWGEARMPQIQVLRRDDEGPDSLLGSRFWMAGRWLLVPHRGEVWIPKARLSSLKFLPDPPVRWGFMLEQVNSPGDPVPDLRITQLNPGSRAEAGGLKVGDRLCTLESLRGEALTLTRVRPLMREAGRTRLPMEVEREGKRLEVVLEVPGTP